MKIFNLFMAIMMALITTSIILWILYTFEESNIGWSILTFVSSIGYTLAALFVYNYKHNTKKIGQLVMCVRYRAQLPLAGSLFYPHYIKNKQYVYISKTYI